MSNKSILQSNNEALSANNLDLQSLIDQANALPDAGGVELPSLSNEGTASDMLSGKQLIDSDGNIITGTFTIDSELSTQDDLISQIQAIVDELPNANTIYIASTEPTNDIGVDGDLYIVRRNSI